MNARPTLSVLLPSFGAAPAGGWRTVVDLARAAEAAGVDRVVLPDHVVMGPNTDEYAWGTFPVRPEAPWLETLTLLTAMAVVTEGVRLSTGILIAPLRPPPLLAKSLATLDVLSGGRLDVGVGTGWQREEYTSSGLDFEARGQLLTDTVAACRALWEQTPATFESKSFSFEDIFCEPKPAQARLPVWFAGVLHARNRRRVVELGDGWIPIMGATTEDVREGAARLREAFERVGRSRDALTVQAALPFARHADGRPDMKATMGAAPELLDAGATDLYTNLRIFDRKLEHPGETFAALVEEFRAATS